MALHLDYYILPKPLVRATLQDGGDLEENTTYYLTIWYGAGTSGYYGGAQSEAADEISFTTTSTKKQVLLEIGYIDPDTGSEVWEKYPNITYTGSYQGHTNTIGVWWKLKWDFYSMKDPSTGEYYKWYNKNRPDYDPTYAGRGGFPNDYYADRYGHIRYNRDPYGSGYVYDSMTATAANTFLEYKVNTNVRVFSSSRQHPQIAWTISTMSNEVNPQTDLNRKDLWVIWGDRDDDGSWDYNNGTNIGDWWKTNLKGTKAESNIWYNDNGKIVFAGCLLLDAYSGRFRLQNFAIQFFAGTSGRAYYTYHNDRSSVDNYPMFINSLIEVPGLTLWRDWGYTHFNKCNYYHGRANSTIYDKTAFTDTNLNVYYAGGNQFTSYASVEGVNFRYSGTQWRYIGANDIVKDVKLTNCWLYAVWGSNTVDRTRPITNLTIVQDDDDVVYNPGYNLYVYAYAGVNNCTLELYNLKYTNLSDSSRYIPTVKLAAPYDDQNDPQQHNYLKLYRKVTLNVLSDDLTDKENLPITIKNTTTGEETIYYTDENGVVEYEPLYATLDMVVTSATKYPWYVEDDWDKDETVYEVIIDLPNWTQQSKTFILKDNVEMDFILTRPYYYDDEVELNLNDDDIAITIADDEIDLSLADDTITLEIEED